MLVNFVLLLLVFGSSKWKKGSYIPAAVIGAIKGAIYLVLARSMLWAVVMATVFFAMAAGMIYFLGRLEKKAEEQPAFTKYALSRPKQKMQWEYGPLVVLILLILFGELLLT